MEPEPFKPLPEHDLLTQLVGEWAFTSHCYMAPDAPPMVNKGTSSVRSLGGLWILSSWKMQSAEGGPENESLLSLGFDPAKSRFVGSFVADCMPGLWVYDGALDASMRVLTLDTEGPSMMPDAEGALTAYRDIYHFISDDKHELRSEMKAGDEWVLFMQATFTRVK